MVGSDLQEESADIDIFLGEARDELIVVHEFKEVVDDAREALGFGGDFGHGGLAGGSVFPGKANGCVRVRGIFGGRSELLKLPLGELANANEIGDRRAKLVSGEFHKAPLGLIGAGKLVDVFLQLAGHLIEIAGEITELIAAEGGIGIVAGEDAGVELASADGGGRLAEAEDRHDDFAVGNGDAENKEDKDEGNADAGDCDRESVDGGHRFLGRLGDSDGPLGKLNGIEAGDRLAFEVDVGDSNDKVIGEKREHGDVGIILVAKSELLGAPRLAEVSGA